MNTCPLISFIKPVVFVIPLSEGPSDCGCASPQGSCPWNGNPHSHPVPEPQRYVAARPRLCSELGKTPRCLNRCGCFLFSACPRPADDFQSSLSAPLAGGLDALLSGEESDDFFDLHIVKHYDPEVRRRVGPPVIPSVSFLCFPQAVRFPENFTLFFLTPAR